MANELRDAAREYLPEATPDPRILYVAIVAQDVSSVGQYQETDFTWLKGREATKISKVQRRYSKIANVSNVVLELDGQVVGQQDTLGELNHFGDRFIVLQFVSARTSSTLGSAQSLDGVYQEFAEVDGMEDITISSPSLRTTLAHRTPTPRPLHETPEDFSNGNMVHPPTSNTAERVDSQHAMSMEDEATHDSSGEPKSSSSNSAHRTPTPNTATSIDYQHVISLENEASAGPHFNRLLQEESVDTLEDGVMRASVFLKKLEEIFLKHDQSSDDEVSHWLTQTQNAIATSKHERVVVVGVVGNTGAGKSSVINAVLDEDMLVPTSCMRACTAVVTEISYNHSDDADSRYRGEIEFVTLDELRKDMELSFSDMLTSEGQISREAQDDPDSDGGIALAKIRSLFPSYNRDDLRPENMENLLNHQTIRHLLGTTKEIKQSSARSFHQQIQRYVDSRQTADQNASKHKTQLAAVTEYWPIIKRVKIFTKAEALSTGAILVDLPGVHDSNSARGAVAAGYLQKCTALWVVAPIIRAVSDKAAKDLLGTSFKRQLKLDGTYSAVTFVCSKTDEISIQEAAIGLGMEQDLDAWQEQLRVLKAQERDMSTSQTRSFHEKNKYDNILDEKEEEIEIWEDLEAKEADGKPVFRPARRDKKRKRTAKGTESRKRIALDHSPRPNVSDLGDESSDSTADGAQDYTPQSKPLTRAAISKKLEQLRTAKKNARTEKRKVSEKVSDLRLAIEENRRWQTDLELQINRLCIEGRNEHSKQMIKQDFINGLRELDTDDMLEEDESLVDSCQSLRDYDAIAKEFNVFCVSSRAYQKLCGRKTMDHDVNGFGTVDQTEIPLLQMHLQKTTKGNRKSAAQKSLNQTGQLVNSLDIWACCDGTNMTESERGAEVQVLQGHLQKLRRQLGGLAKECKVDLESLTVDLIFIHFENAVNTAAQSATRIAKGWGRPRNDGGLAYQTYLAVCRRYGTYSSKTAGLQDWNAQLTEPLVKSVATGWERMFQQSSPKVIQNYKAELKIRINEFHEAVEGQMRKTGAGIAKLPLLKQQIEVYKQSVADIANSLITTINEAQRDANRNFCQSITSQMNPVYEQCAGERGSGAFARMKADMEVFIEGNRWPMFESSVRSVRKHLITLALEAEQYIEEKTRGVFTDIQRDYTSAIGGVQASDLPREELFKLRNTVASLLDSMDGYFNPQNSPTGTSNEPASVTPMDADRIHSDSSCKRAVSSHDSSSSDEGMSWLGTLD